MIPHEAREAARARLRARLRERPEPLLLFPDATLPAASWWAGSRRWIEAGRAAGLNAGDPLWVELPIGPGLAMVVVAAWWEGWSLATEPPPWPVRARVAAAAGEGAWAADDPLNPGRARLVVAPPQSRWWLGQERDVAALYRALTHGSAVGGRRWTGGHDRAAFVDELTFVLANEVEVLGFGFTEPDVNGA